MNSYRQHFTTRALDLLDWIVQRSTLGLQVRVTDATGRQHVLAVRFTPRTTEEAAQRVAAEWMARPHLAAVATAVVTGDTITFIEATAQPLWYEVETLEPEWFGLLRRPAAGLRRLLGRWA